MYSKEERKRAIDLLLKYDLCFSDTIAELGYPDYSSLRQWYADYIKEQETGIERPDNPYVKYTQKQKETAVDYYNNHGRSISRTIRALGYPSRAPLVKWLSIRNDRKKGMSYSEIGRIYNIDRRTAKKYCESNVKPDYKYTSPRKRKIDAYSSYIDELLAEAPYSAVRIQELVEEHFHTKIGYTTIQEYVKKTKHNYNHQATVRFETMPGLQGQVDWGFFENYTVKDINGEEKKLYCFLMILGYSRMRYIEFVTDMSTQTLIRCHLNAFDYFGGYPEEILYDNMKQVVVKRLLKQKDSTLNKTFEDFAGFFNFKPVLCRPYRGQTKGKIERTVRYVRENFMVGIKYKNLEDLNRQAYAWCEKVNNI